MDGINETIQQPEQPQSKPTLKKRRKLTAKQEGFVKDFLETKNASEAIRRNYNVAGAQEGLITGMASENLANPSIQEMIKNIKAMYVTDSYEAYAVQKDIMHKSVTTKPNYELANKIANKIQDRAGLAPTYKSESKSLQAHWVINRGESGLDKPT